MTEPEDAYLANGGGRPYLDGAVDGPREEASSGHGQRRHAALVSQQRLGADHVVHAPHLQNTPDASI